MAGWGSRPGSSAVLLDGGVVGASSGGVAPPVRPSRGEHGLGLATGNAGGRRSGIRPTGRACTAAARGLDAIGNDGFDERGQFIPPFSRKNRWPHMHFWPARANIQLCSKGPAQRLYQSLACHSLAATAVLTFWLRATPAGLRSAATINLKEFAVSARRWHTLDLLNTIGMPQIRKLHWLIKKLPGVVASGLRPSKAKLLRKFIWLLHRPASSTTPPVCMAPERRIQVQ